MKLESMHLNYKKIKIINLSKILTTIIKTPKFRSWYTLKILHVQKSIALFLIIPGNFPKKCDARKNIYIIYIMGVNKHEIGKYALKLKKKSMNWSKILWRYPNPLADIHSKSYNSKKV